MKRSYGITKKDEFISDLDLHVENITIKGLSIFKSLLSKEKCEVYRNKIEDIYLTQKNEIGEENIEKINERDMVRMPFAFDDDFFDLILLPEIKNVLETILGENYILHLQNAIINRPNKIHHQSSWHRDLPYQNFVISSPLSLNAFICLSPFNNTTGGTIFLPYSHRGEIIPSDSFIKNNLIQPNLEIGDVIMFDSMVLHKAGNNTSDLTRIGINHVYTLPLLTQQLDIPEMLGELSNPNLSKYADLLGYKFKQQNSVISYRLNKLNKANV